MLRLAQDHRAAAQAAPPGHFQSWLDLHLRGQRLQPGAYAETAGSGSSIRITQGSSVPAGLLAAPGTTRQRSQAGKEPLPIPTKLAKREPAGENVTPEPYFFRSLLAIARPDDIEGGL